MLPEQRSITVIIRTSRSLAHAHQGQQKYNTLHIVTCDVTLYTVFLQQVHIPGSIFVSPAHSLTPPTHHHISIIIGYIQ